MLNLSHDYFIFYEDLKKKLLLSQKGSSDGKLLIAPEHGNGKP